MKKFSFVIALGALVLALVVAPAATAQNPSTDVYGGEGGEVVSSTAGGGPSSGDPDGTAPAASSGTLPFTGLDVGLIAGGGLVLLLIGLGMARLIPKHEHS